jgi:Zn-finger nucleic acid-binding protein
MICPQCQPQGTELKVSSRSGIEIDYCPVCRGVWLDRGELDKILDREAEFTAKRPAIDPQLERERLELERKRQEIEAMKQRATTDQERRRHEEDFRTFEASMRTREDLPRQEARRPAEPYREPPRRREGYYGDEGFGGERGERGEYGGDGRGYGHRKGRRRDSLLGEIFDIFGD